MDGALDSAPDPTRLLIIAPRQFSEPLTMLYTHKNLHGMPTHIVWLEEIVQGTPPSDHPLLVKQLIYEAHRRLGVYYVMLVGNASQIPVRHRFVQQTDDDRNRHGMDGTYNPSDNYYCNLLRDDGQSFSDWDYNHNGKYNESIWGLSPAATTPIGWMDTRTSPSPGSLHTM